MVRPKGPIERRKMMTILLSEEEHEQIRQLAARAGLDVSSYVRSWIRSETEKHLKKGRGR